jgi:hypothetical protein
VARAAASQAKAAAAADHAALSSDDATAERVGGDDNGRGGGGESGDDNDDGDASVKGVHTRGFEAVPMALWGAAEAWARTQLRGDFFEAPIGQLRIR